LIISCLRLLNYRNHQSNSFELNPLGNLIIGPNGSGKTNLLEAIAYCGIGKSLRLHKDDQITHYDAEGWRIGAVFSLDSGSTMELEITYSASGKLLKLDGTPLKMLSTLFEYIKVIYLAPEDLSLISGSPRKRRQFFDLAISQLFPAYIGVLRGFLQVVAQRNALLKTQYDPQQKRIWDSGLIKANNEVLSYRLHYLELLNQQFEQMPNIIHSVEQNPCFSYQAQLKDFQDLSEAEQLAHLQKLEQREQLWQRSLVGAHLDDYEVSLDGKSMKDYASQGQKRMAAIALKLAHASLLQNHTSIKPILLFDDIFAELDAQHSMMVKSLVNNGLQVFVASPKPDVAEIWPELTQLAGFGRGA
jgi:DNA replication and repair protein RecF